jgi:uncharacterized protein YodC (DUF2158 family)
MATAFKKGDIVSLKAVVPSGPVQALRMDEDGTVYYRIEWVDADGVSQERWFEESALKAGA